MGLIFACTSHSVFWVLVTFYVIAVIYLTIIMICVLANKPPLNNKVALVTEIVIGILIIAYTIYVTASSAEKDIWLILAIVVGFILPALFFITAYDKT